MINISTIIHLKSVKKTIIMKVRIKYEVYDTLDYLSLSHCNCITFVGVGMCRCIFIKDIETHFFVIFVFELIIANHEESQYSLQINRKVGNH